MGDLKKWVDQKWVDIGAPKKDGKYQPCGRKSAKGSKRKYPKGYSGKIGIWKDYFSERNYSNYLKVLSSKFNTGIFGEEIKNLYHDYWPLS